MDLMSPVINQALKAGHVGFVTDTYTQTKKKRPIFMVLYLSIQLRCCHKNKTKMFIKRPTYKNWKLFDFIFWSWRVIKPNVHTAFSIIIRKLIIKKCKFYVKWQPDGSNDEKTSKNPKFAYWTSEIAVPNLSLTKITKITSLWIKQLTI